MRLSWRHHGLQAALLAVLGVVVPSMAKAAEEAQKSGTLPQLDMTLWPGQIFWFLLSFGLLYLLISKVVMPPLASTLEHRQGLIDSDLASAERMAESAKATRAGYEEALARARAMAQANVSTIVAAAATESATQQQAQQQALQQRMAEADARIRATRDKALAEVRGSARDLAHVVVEKAAGLRLKGG